MLNAGSAQPAWLAWATTMALQSTNCLVLRETGRRASAVVCPTVPAVATQGLL